MDRNKVLTILLLGIVLGLVLISGPTLLWGNRVAAQPPPTKSPVPTSTDTGVPPPTDTNTPPPTATPRPTTTPIPQPTSPSTTPPPNKTKTPKPPPPNPACQSSVSGYVLNQAGETVAGATVSISGEGWANAMLTNDEGQYGFAGLCAGAATLQATLPDGQLTASVAVEFDGKNSIALDLGLSSLAVPQTTSAALPTPTPEPEMPQTGYSGWALAGGAILGVLLLLFAGARRTLKQGS